MENRVIVTIGRQMGSGGYAVGNKLAELLGVSFYDRELLAIAAKESGLNKTFFERADERTTHGLSSVFAVGLPYTGMFTSYTDILSNDGLFKMQSDAIRHLAQKESCVLIGRCADYILRDMPNVLSIFISSPMKECIQNVVNRTGISEEQAAELITKTNKARAAYYNYYTNKRWGEAASYDLSIDSSYLGIDETASLINHVLKKKFNR